MPRVTRDCETIGIDKNEDFDNITFEDLDEENEEEGEEGKPGRQKTAFRRMKGATDALTRRHKFRKAVNVAFWR